MRFFLQRALVRRFAGTPMVSLSRLVKGVLSCPWPVLSITLRRHLDQRGRHGGEVTWTSTEDTGESVTTLAPTGALCTSARPSATTTMASSTSGEGVRRLRAANPASAQYRRLLCDVTSANTEVTDVCITAWAILVCHCPTSPGQRRGHGCESVKALAQYCSHCPTSPPPTRRSRARAARGSRSFAAPHPSPTLPGGQHGGHG